MQTVVLNLVPSGVNPIVYASQHDVGRMVRFPLVNGDLDMSWTLNGAETLTVSLTRPDGSEVTFSVPNPGSGKDYVDVTFDYASCEQSGVCLGELRMVDGDQDVGSINFVLKVEADAYGDDVEVKTASGSIATFETALSDNVVELTAEINPVQSGSGTPSPSNPRPISGFTECNIADCGKNLYSVDNGEYDADMYDGSGNVVHYADINVVTIPVKPNTDYSFMFGNTPSSVAYVRIAYLDENNGFISRDGVYSNSQFPINKTIPNNCHFIQLQINENDAAHIADNDWVFGVIEGANASFEPYHGNLVTVAFGQTVYGGVLTCKNGAWKVTSTHAYIDDWTNIGFVHNGSTATFSELFCTPIPNKAYGDSNLVSNKLETGVFSLYGINGRNSNGNIYFDVPVCSTALEGKQWIMENDISVCYELTTPIEIDLTAEQVATLVGLNNVFHDANGEIEVKYLDIKG